MNTIDIEKYAEIMKEIKLRVGVITLFLSQAKDAHYEPATVETVGLQFRKIFELIAFAPLVANRTQYSSAYNDFAKHWKAKELLNNLAEINPNFYPQPVVEITSVHPTAKHGLEPRKRDYLTKEQLIEAHGKCGSLMHAQNPFAKAIDYGFYKRKFPVWRSRIMNLLNNHKIQLVNDPGMWLIHMKEIGHEEVKWYRFEPVGTSSNPLN